MYKLLNVHTKEMLAIEVKNEDKTIVFNIKSIVSKRKKEELDENKQFLLLEAYIDYKGQAFKKALMERYLEAEELITMSIMKKNLLPLPYSIVHNILDMFDFADVFLFIRDVYKVKPPKTLKVVFDKQYEKDNEGTREQTYLQHDYLELATLVIILKAVTPIIGEFGYKNSSKVDGAYKDYILFQFIHTHKIFDSDPMKKLKAFVEKLKDVILKKDELMAIRIIEKKVSQEDLSLYILSSVIFARIVMATIIDDGTNPKNVVTRMHGYIQSKLTNRKDVSTTIQGKKALLDAESGNNDRESIVESYRVISSMTKGWEVEFNWATSDKDFIIQEIESKMGVAINRTIVEDISKVCDYFLTTPITKEQHQLLGYIFKKIIDPRALLYLETPSIVNLLTVGFAYLWEIDCKYLAILLTSIIEEIDDDITSINSTVNRSRMSKELKDELMELYPYTRTINKLNSANIAEEAINELSNRIYSLRWLSTAPRKYIEQVVTSRTDLKSLPVDLKSKLAGMIIKIER